jgi:predicted HNH restriction endonuclease
MKHPPSRTVGRKYWLAKVWTTLEAHIEKGEYCFSPADFDPRKLSIKDAREAGKAKTLFPPYGRLFGAQIWRMAHEAKLGDVIFLESANRHVHAWGTVTGTYQLRSVKNPTRDNLIRAGIHQIGVAWHEVTSGKDAFRIGKADNLLFREITDRKDLLPLLTKFIDSPLPSSTRQGGEDTPQDLEYREGGKVLQTHLRTERDAKAAKLAKELARKRSKTGKISCEACRCVPEDDYRGLDLIEAHHRIPLSRGVRETNLEDFAMLCPCCHRAVHKLINLGLDPVVSLNNVAQLNR